MTTLCVDDAAVLSPCRYNLNDMLVVHNPLQNIVSLLFHGND